MPVEDRLYDDAEDFFSLNGSVSMRLTPEAAVEVCLSSAGQGLVVACLEGGVWQNPGFMSRLDCIWDGAEPPISAEAAQENNYKAAAFVKKMSGEHDVFILTAPPITGWPHKAGQATEK